MTEQEKHYRGFMAAIGRTMLIFFVLINLFGISYVIFDEILYALPISYTARTVTSQLFYGAGYMLSFMLPVVFLRLWLKKCKYKPQPMYLEPKWTPYMPLAILAGIAVCYAAAIFNQTLTSFLDIFSPMQDLTGASVVSMEPYEIVLQFIVICIVPGFCEEFLFRGAILTNCLPFGRTNAIIISSLLFAVMHQNFDQLLYTFVAGVVMGLIYERTRSIWPSTFLHICNNFLSVIISAVASKEGIGETGSLILMLIDCIVFTLGTVAAVILIYRFCSKKRDLCDGVFGHDLPAADSYADLPVSSARARKLFCTPCMVIFLSLSLVSMILLVFIGG
ncbi:MAG: CPBP family intramembrane metalloprotease [Clostridia bacterium]|nr:CPBP family intramembrane metalloprotease [Clostridia bacterium]